jgi:hypothetical protein
LDVVVLSAVGVELRLLGSVDSDMAGSWGLIRVWNGRIWVVADRQVFAWLVWLADLGRNLGWNFSWRWCDLWRQLRW